MFIAQQINCQPITSELLQQLGSSFWVGLEHIGNQRDQAPDLLSAAVNVYDNAGALTAGPFAMTIQQDATQPPLLQAGYLLQTGAGKAVTLTGTYRVVYSLTLRTGEIQTVQQSFVIRSNPF